MRVRQRRLPNEMGLGPPWLIEACLNHVTLVAFTTPISEVCERWSAHVSRLVSAQQPAVPLPPQIGQS